MIDEAHHLLPSAWGPAPYTLPQRLGETVLITHRPSEVVPAMLAMMDIVVAVGPSPERTLAEFAGALGLASLRFPKAKRDEAIIWERGGGLDPYAATIVPARSARLRHLRKYAEGNLGPRSFFFRGPATRMNLRAQNLTVFCDLATGVDDETWQFHLGRGDYSAWLAATIKDDDLAGEVAEVEHTVALTPSDSRRLVCEAIDRRYMLPA